MNGNATNVDATNVDDIKLELTENQNISNMVRGNLDIENDNDNRIINVIKEITNGGEYTPEVVATSKNFIKLLNAAMKDNKAHQIQWEKITPTNSNSSHIKRLAIQNILNDNDLRIDTNTKMTKTVDGLQQKIPIILEINNCKNTNNIFGKLIDYISSPKATLCGYLLNCVFSQEREGEEFVLLAMYVAVNINNVCFNNYINEKGNNETCNKAFTNIAKILNLAHNDNTSCEQTFETFKSALINTYGIEYKDDFITTIKNKAAALPPLTLVQNQNEFNRITYNYKNDTFQNDVYQNNAKLRRYIDVIKILKEKKVYEVDGIFMKNAVNKYIETGDEDNIIKSRNEKKMNI